MDWEKELESFKLFSKPKKSSSKTSKSLYFGIKKFKNKVLILQYLPKNSKTSRHYHENIKEKHIILSGKCYIKKKGKLRLLKNEEITKPKEIHYLETKKEACLILLEINHNGKINWKKDKILL